MPKPISYLREPPKPPADTRFFIRLSSLSYGELAGLLAMAWAFGFCVGFLFGFSHAPGMPSKGL